MLKTIVKIIRNIILTSAFILTGIGALVLRYCVFSLRGLFLKKKEYKMLKYSEILQNSWKFLIWYLQTFKIIEISADINQLKNIKNKIIVSSHPSFLDIVILISIIPHSTCFVAEKLAKNPFFKGMVGVLFILKGQNSDKWVSDACKMIDNGMNVIIFPMGSRHKQDERPKIRRGVSLLALKSQKNICVLNMKTSSDFLQSGQPFYDAGAETVKYTVSYIDEINTKAFIEKYPDNVTFKTELSKEIARIIY